MQAIVKAINISKEKGTAKYSIPSTRVIEDFGLENDAHGGKWHRQVSLLAYEKVDEFNQSHNNIAKYGTFGENLLLEGVDLDKVAIYSTIKINDVILEVTQRGKQCHSGCNIFKQVNDCIMPRCGLFAKVVHGGVINVNDKVEIIEPDLNRPFSAAVITLSDKGSRNERVDESGPVVCRILEDNHYDIVETLLLPDDKNLIKQELIRLADKRNVDLIITTGGTGFSVRDVTPEATLEIMERNAFGISEYMRARSAQITNRGILSRGVSVIRKNSLIINLPGSPKAAKENLEFVIDALDHGLKILRGSASECATK